jgi:hypothetical protein
MGKTDRDTAASCADRRRQEIAAVVARVKAAQPQAERQ